VGAGSSAICYPKARLIAAKQRLDETAPLEQAVSASGLGEAILAVFKDCWND
jgi:hypothetical protein